MWNGAACIAVRAHIVSERLPAEAHADNCVFFARKHVPSLPYGMQTWKGKLEAVNSRVPSRAVWR